MCLNSCAVVTIEAPFIFVEQASFQFKRVSSQVRFLPSFQTRGIESARGIDFTLESAPILTGYWTIPRRESCLSAPSVGTFCVVNRYGIFVGLELGHVERIKEDG